MMRFLYLSIISITLVNCFPALKENPWEEVRVWESINPINKSKTIVSDTIMTNSCYKLTDSFCLTKSDINHLFEYFGNDSIVESPIKINNKIIFINSYKEIRIKHKTYEIIRVSGPRISNYASFYLSKEYGVIVKVSNRKTIRLLKIYFPDNSSGINVSLLSNFIIEDSLLSKKPDIPN